MSTIDIRGGGGGGGGGVSDHGALTGNGDDDHTQYALADGTRGDFAATSHNHDSTYVNVTGDTMTGDLTLAGAPTATLHAATKAYVDTVAAGQRWKDAARARTTAALAGTWTYDNGTGGVGATLTRTSDTNALQAQDGVTLSLGDRLLVANQSPSTLRNGIYEVTDAGGGTNVVLTRVTDADATAELDSAAVFIVEGTLYANTTWVQKTDDPVVGTDAIVWSQTGGGTVNADETTLTKSGATMSVKSLGVGTGQIANASVTVGKISASGVPGPLTYLDGSGAWSTPPSSGGVMPALDHERFLDPVNGSDANDGTTWALAKKTLFAATVALKPLAGTFCGAIYARSGITQEKYASPFFRNIALYGAGSGGGSSTTYNPAGTYIQASPSAAGVDIADGIIANEGSTVARVFDNTLMAARGLPNMPYGTVDTSSWDDWAHNVILQGVTIDGNRQKVQSGGYGINITSVGYVQAFRDVRTIYCRKSGMKIARRFVDFVGDNLGNHYCGKAEPGATWTAANPAVFTHPYGANHGLKNGDMLQVRDIVWSLGSSANLTAGTNYYVVSANQGSPGTFQLATERGGTGIDLSGGSVGSCTLSIYGGVLFELRAGASGAIALVSGLQSDDNEGAMIVVDSSSSSPNNGIIIDSPKLESKDDQSTRLVTSIDVGADTITFDTTTGISVGDLVWLSGMNDGRLDGPKDWAMYWVKTKSSNTLSFSATIGGPTLALSSAHAAWTGLTGCAGAVATDTFTKTAHGLLDGWRVRVSSIVNLTGLSTGTDYYVRDATANTFKLTTTATTGSAVNLGGTDGTVTVKLSGRLYKGGGTPYGLNDLVYVAQKNAVNGPTITIRGAKLNADAHIRNDPVWQAVDHAVARFSPIDSVNNGARARVRSSDHTTTGSSYTKMVVDEEDGYSFGDPQDGGDFDYRGNPTGGGPIVHYIGRCAIAQGSGDPNAAELVLPPGSIYMRSGVNGEIYGYDDSGTTSPFTKWVKFAG